MSATLNCADTNADKNPTVAVRQQPDGAFPALVTAVLAYEDAELERLGRVLWEVVRRQFSGHGVLNMSEWKFEMLSQPALREFAATEADAADVVVIAARDRGPLPSGVEQWMACWSSPPSARRRVLVLLLESTSDALDTPALDHALFARRAKECSMELIVQPFELSASKLRPCLYSELGDWRCILPIAHSLRSRESVSQN